GKRPAIIWTTATILFLHALVLTTIFWFLASKLSEAMFQTAEHMPLFRIAFVGLFLTTLNEPFYSYLRMDEQAKTFVRVTLLGSFLTAGLSAVFVLILGWGTEGYMLAPVISQLVILVILLTYMLRQLPYSWNAQYGIPLVKIGFPSIFGLFAFMIIDYADRQLIQRFLGLEQLGLYSLGYSFGMIMLVLVNAFASAWPPFFMSFIGRQDEAKVLFGKVLKAYLALFSIACVGFFALARPVLELLTASSFHGAHAVVGIIAASYLLRGCYLIFLPGVYFSQKLYVQSVIEWLAAGVNILLNLQLIASYGIVGAALATLASYTILPVTTWIVSRRHLAVNYDWNAIVRIVGACVASCLILHRLSRDTSLTLFMLLSFLVFASYVLWVLGGCLTSEERHSVVKGKLLVSS
ncbi:MAG TPA: oligosaccharide flippase family protein, partial [Candidatus Ozemobacteraceae bacterium]|nr:oligosaccharide flippase family protein [Candidatus Ozemobacteraceae bacterium]